MQNFNTVLRFLENGTKSTFSITQREKINTAVACTRRMRQQNGPLREVEARGSISTIS